MYRGIDITIEHANILTHRWLAVSQIRRNVQSAGLPSPAVALSSSATRPASAAPAAPSQWTGRLLLIDEASMTADLDLADLLSVAASHRHHAAADTSARLSGAGRPR